MAAGMSTMSEERIGGYRLIRTIYPGVTATVMEVQDSTGRRFALKQLLASRGEEPAERRAFEREARIGLELQHPNLIRYHSYVRDAEQPYFVMDYFSGNHLRLPIAQPQKYPLPKGQLHRIISQAASALAYMHDKGWIHRDVKPENTLVNKAGEVRVIDYTLTLKPLSGLEKLFGKKVPRQGTKSYMSPEQIMRESPAPAADIYSFGATCYELACGRPPFRANSEGELLGKHLKETPSPPTNYNKTITAEFSNLVLSMLRKKPTDRPADLHEFLRRFATIRIYQDDAPPQGLGSF